MYIDKVNTGEKMYFDDSPFDTVKIILPRLNNKVWDATPDMGTGNALTMQATGTANMTNTGDWNGNAHFNHSNGHPGQGNLIVIRNSNTAMLFNKLYNAINPMGANGEDKASVTYSNAKKVWFNVFYYNSASVVNHKPTVYSLAEGCYFNNPAALQVSNGSNNSQNTETWTYIASAIYKTEGNNFTSGINGQDTSGLSDIVQDPSTVPTV